MNRQSSRIDARVSKRIKALISQSPDGLFSVEIQKLTFYADCKAVEKKGCRFTNVDFKPMMYGAYSEEINNIINHISSNDKNVLTEKSIRNGNTDIKYSYVGRVDLDSNIVGFIDEVIEETKQYSLSELTNISRDNYMYNRSSRNESLSFKNYRDKLESGDGDIEDITGSFVPSDNIEDTEWGFDIEP